MAAPPRGHLLLVVALERVLAEMAPPPFAGVPPGLGLSNWLPPGFRTVAKRPGLGALNTNFPS